MKVCGCSFIISLPFYIHIFTASFSCLPKKNHMKRYKATAWSVDDAAENGVFLSRGGNGGERGGSRGR